jgi:hypothetical protein
MPCNAELRGNVEQGSGQSTPPVSEHFAAEYDRAINYHDKKFGA